MHPIEKLGAVNGKAKQVFKQAKDEQRGYVGEITVPYN